MAHIQYFSHTLQITPPPVDGSKIAVLSDHIPLQDTGFNLPVLLTEILPKDSNIAPKSLLVMGHFDTGASKTCIDARIAEMLGLTPIGVSLMRTANSVTESPNYILNLAFPNTQLKPFNKIQVGSCDLRFDFNQQLNLRNMGLLIGRDVMSRWNIVWHGPSSSVFISD
jgi:hypothetical protein